MNIEEKIANQDIKLVKLETLMEGMAEDMKKISSAMETQTKIMLQLTSLEDYTKDSVNRIHKRIDKNEVEIETIKAVPNKILMRAAMAATAILVGYVLMSMGVS